jgi:hypothetical protein
MMEWRAERQLGRQIASSITETGKLVLNAAVRDFYCAIAH